MGLIWRSIRDSVVGKATGELRRQYAYAPSPEFMEALRAELRRALLRAGECPHGEPVAIDSFDLHWGSAEESHLRLTIGAPTVSVRYACRHDQTAGSFSPEPGIVVIGRPVPTADEVAAIVNEQRTFERTMANGAAQLEELDRRRIERQLGQRPSGNRTTRKE